MTLAGSKWTISVALAAIAATWAALWGGALAETVATALLGQADQIRAGQLWRLLTAPLIHTSGSHLLWDVGVLVAIGVAYERQLARVWPLLIVLGSIVPVASVLWTHPNLAGYGGLSGMTYCLMAAAMSFELVRGKRPWLLLAAGAVLMVKVAWEMGGGTGTAGFALDLGAGAQPVPIAHLAGIIVGVVVVAANQKVQLARVKSSSTHTASSKQRSSP